MGYNCRLPYGKQFRLSLAPLISTNALRCDSTGKSNPFVPSVSLFHVFSFENHHENLMDFCRARRFSKHTHSTESKNLRSKCTIKAWRFFSKSSEEVSEYYYQNYRISPGFMCWILFPTVQFLHLFHNLSSDDRRPQEQLFNYWTIGQYIFRCLLAVVGCMAVQ